MTQHREETQLCVCVSVFFASSLFRPLWKRNTRSEGVAKWNIIGKIWKAITDIDSRYVSIWLLLGGNNTLIDACKMQDMHHGSEPSFSRCSCGKMFVAFNATDALLPLHDNSPTTARTKRRIENAEWIFSTRSSFAMLIIWRASIWQHEFLSQLSSRKKR